jgi:putative transposase
VPGGTAFLTLAMHRLTPLFSEYEDVFRLRVAVAQMLTERPFEILEAVVLPEHILFFGDCRQTIQIVLG